jgi:hypothetical protein
MDQHVLTVCLKSKCIAQIQNKSNLSVGDAVSCTLLSTVDWEARCHLMQRVRHDVFSQFENIETLCGS